MEFNHDLPGDIIQEWRVQSGLGSVRDKRKFAQKLGISVDSLRRWEAITKWSDPHNWEKKGGLDQKQIDLLIENDGLAKGSKWEVLLRESIPYQNRYIQWYNANKLHEGATTIELPTDPSDTLELFEDLKFGAKLYSRLIRTPGCLTLIVLQVLFYLLFDAPLLHLTTSRSVSMMLTMVLTTIQMIIVGILVYGLSTVLDNAIFRAVPDLAKDRRFKVLIMIGSAALISGTYYVLYMQFSNTTFLRLKLEGRSMYWGKY